MASLLTTSTTTIVKPTKPPKPPNLFKEPLRVCIDVEITDTSSRDIDDTLLLMLVASDPRFDIACVTVTPGSREQIQVVRCILHLAGKSTPLPPIGATDWGNKKPEKVKICKNARYLLDLNEEYAIQASADFSDIQDAGELLAKHCGKNTTVITGSTLENLASALSWWELKQEGDIFCKRWIGQGGFVSDTHVPNNFRGGTLGGDTCTSYNLQKLQATNGVLKAVKDGRILEGLLVSSKRHRLPANEWGNGWKVRMAMASNPKKGKTEKNYNEKFYNKERRDTLKAILSLNIQPNKAVHDLMLLAVSIFPGVCSWTNMVSLKMKKTGAGDDGGGGGDDDEKEEEEEEQQEEKEVIKNLKGILKITSNPNVQKKKEDDVSIQKNIQWKTESIPPPALNEDSKNVDKRGVRMAYMHNGIDYYTLVLPLSEKAEKEFQEQVSEKEINFNEAEYSRKGKKYKYFDCFKDEKYKYFKPIVVKGAKKDYPNGKKNSKKKTGNEKVRGKKKRARNRGPKHR